MICTLPVEWPTGISADFNVLSRLYRGTKTIVRYDSGTATQYHTLFQTESLDAVVEYFRTRYGPPNETLERRTSLYMLPSRLNRTALWRKADAGAGGHTVLEIREIDEICEIDEINEIDEIDAIDEIGDMGEIDEAGEIYEIDEMDEICESGVFHPKIL